MRVCPRCRSIYSVPVESCGLDGTPIIEQVEDPLVGFEVDRYRVIAPIGRGAMGCVYRARHTHLDSECAIKVLYGNYAVNRRLIERFRREGNAISKMKHPNIVSVIDFGTTDAGLTFLLMELVEGRSLEAAIEKEAPFDPSRAARIARQIASGLGEAHRRGYIHRDMKPANVMLTRVDDFEMVKLLDFGVVGLMQAAAAAKLTAAGHIVGTPSYMAPEQARTSSVSPAADLYALGCILYEMLAGKPPFEGLGVAEVLLKHLHEAPPPLASARGLERIAAWLLEKDPEKRPASAVRVIAELDRLSLGTANTEQIMVTRVLSSSPTRKTTVPNAGDQSDTLDLDTEKHAQEDLTEPTRIDDRPPPTTDPAVLHVADPEKETADLPASVTIAKDPSGDDDPRLVAPPITPGGVRPNPAELKTELDVRLAQRPVVTAGAPHSFSAPDTEPPDETPDLVPVASTMPVPMTAPQRAPAIRATAPPVRRPPYAAAIVSALIAALIALIAVLVQILKNRG